MLGLTIHYKHWHESFGERFKLFCEMALQMTGGPGKRYKQFTRDNAQVTVHTCNGIVILCKSLLSKSRIIMFC